MGKLPYIPDKDTYRAVVGACSYIRETGWFNKATSYYAKKYNVDVDEVRKFVRIAQGNGQKEAAKNSPKKYKWYAVEYSMGGERNGGAYFESEYACYEVRKGLNEGSVMRTMCKNDEPWNEYAAVHWFGRIKEFSSKDEAEQCVEDWRKEKWQNRHHTLK